MIFEKLLVCFLIYLLIKNRKKNADVPLLNNIELGELGINITGVTDTEHKETEENSIIVKDPYFNPSGIVSYNPEEQPKKFIYRPNTLNEYIGQEKAKALAMLNIRKVKELKPVHFLISGHRGCGKTTLAYIIKNELNAMMIERIAGQIQNPDQIVDLINEINASKAKRVVLFIDEIHALNPKLCENLYPIMEDFKIQGRDIKPFILIGATTEKNILMNKVAPLVDRFQVQIELSPYNKDDIKKILLQYKQQLFPDREMKQEHFDIISKNSKFTPRIAITLLEDNLIEPNIDKVLDCHRIIKDGLTDIDFRILEILKENKRAIGEKALAQMIGISNADYSSLYEAYLISQGFIIRTSRGRVLGAKGEQYLEVNNGTK